MEVSRADSNHDQQAPDHVDSSTTVSCVVPVEDHEEGGHDKEENIGDSVDELCHVWSVGVVVLAPINGRRSSLQMFPHHSLNIEANIVKNHSATKIH